MVATIDDFRHGIDLPVSSLDFLNIPANRFEFRRTGTHSNSLDDGGLRVRCFELGPLGFQVEVHLRVLDMLCLSFAWEWLFPKMVGILWGVLGKHTPK